MYVIDLLDMDINVFYFRRQNLIMALQVVAQLKF